MISLPKDFKVDPAELAQRLLNFAITLENQVNGGPQVYVVDRLKNKQYPRNPKRRDILFRIKQQDGADIIKIYWYDGKTWQPLKLSSIDGDIDSGNITNFDFLSLTDTPDSYVGNIGRVVAVNGTEDGLEFIDAPNGSGSGDCCEILVQDGVSGPPVMLTLEDESDFLYSDQIATVQ